MPHLSDTADLLDTRAASISQPFAYISPADMITLHKFISNKLQALPAKYQAEINTLVKV